MEAINTRRNSETIHESKSINNDNENSDKSSPGLFSSVGFWGIRDNIFSGLSSKLEAAFQVGFDAAFSDNSCDHQNPKPKLARSNTSTSFPRKAKDRSVFGQPEVNNQNQSLHSNKEQSLDSLDTIDSGQSMGGSSYGSVSELRNLELYDPLKFYRTADSIGIGSGQSTSIESSDAEESANEDYKRSESQLSIKSWASSLSGDSQRTEEFNRDAKTFMKSFVGKIFNYSNSITLEEKAKFGNMCRSEIGRLWFARYINEHRVNGKKVDESTFYSLAQYFAIVLFECADSDDFTPAKTIMNMCFTYYHEPSSQMNPSQQKSQQYLYHVLREQPIWRTFRFWNAAFFDAVQCERSHRPTPTRSQLHKYTSDDMREEAKYQENITFGQLGAFIHNMHSFGLPKEFCLEFLRKQCIIANLPHEHVSLLRENIERMYARCTYKSPNDRK